VPKQALLLQALRTLLERRPEAAEGQDLGRLAALHKRSPELALLLLHQLLLCRDAPRDVARYTGRAIGALQASRCPAHGSG
jgi:hypothetical protein